MKKNFHFLEINPDFKQFILYKLLVRLKTEIKNEFNLR